MLSELGLALDAINVLENAEDEKLSKWQIDWLLTCRKHIHRAMKQVDMPYHIGNSNEDVDNFLNSHSFKKLSFEENPVEMEFSSLT